MKTSFLKVTLSGRGEQGHRIRLWKAVQSIVQLRETISHLVHSLSDIITHDINFHLCDYTTHILLLS